MANIDSKLSSNEYCRTNKFSGLYSLITSQTRKYMREMNKYCTSSIMRIFSTIILLMKESMKK
jgi:hypothetical protein